MAAKSRSQINQEIRSLDLAAQAQQQEVDELKGLQIEQADVGTRQRIATIFVIAYFSLLLLLIISVPIYNLVAYHVGNREKTLQIPLGDILQTYSAIVGPALGFVIAYYFKSKNET